MGEFTMQLNSPITEEQWNAITDAELEHSEEIEFTTPSGKKVAYRKIIRCMDCRNAKFIQLSEIGEQIVSCTVSGDIHGEDFFCAYGVRKEQ